MPLVCRKLGSIWVPARPLAHFRLWALESVSRHWGVIHTLTAVVDPDAHSNHLEIFKSPSMHWPHTCPIKPESGSRVQVSMFVKISPGDSNIHWCRKKINVYEGPPLGCVLIKIGDSRLRPPAFKSCSNLGNYQVWEKLNPGLRVSIC